MKGIIKGSVFSVVLTAILICVLSIIRLYADIPDIVSKGILWAGLGLCVFFGCLPVSRSASGNKLIRGIASSLITILLLGIAASVAGRGVPGSSAFYCMSLICFVCGLLGSFVGARGC